MPPVRTWYKFDVHIETLNKLLEVADSGSQGTVLNLYGMEIGVVVGLFDGDDHS